MRKRPVAIAIALAALFVAVPLLDAALNRGELALAVANAGLRAPLPGHAWRTGTFEGLRPPDVDPTQVVLEGRTFPVTSSFDIKRTWVWWSPSYWRGAKRLLELPDWGAWDGYRGSTAWYQVKLATGEVSRLIIVQKRP